MESLSTSELIVIALVFGLPLLLAGVLIGRRARRAEPRRPELIKRTRQLGTFEARDSRGKLVTLAIFQEYLDAGTRDNSEAERPGRRIIMSTDGRHVSKIGTRKYRIMGSPETLTSDDPTAP